MNIKLGYLYISLFFFQAEDGIRDLYVTGVQTCALPISVHALFNGGTLRDDAARPFNKACTGPLARLWPQLSGRSEERRVGKECRSRWSRYHDKKNKN